MLKHEPTANYFDLARQRVKCMMGDDSSNSYFEPVRTEMTGTKQIPISRDFDSEDTKSKEILLDETISEMCSTDEI